MWVYKLLSLALEYPDREFYAHLDEMAGRVHADADLAEPDRRVLLGFLDRVRDCSLLALQEEYVRTFDLTPNHALYLTHHIFEEEDRERGPTLVELHEYFASQGLTVAGGELPDYLPLILEYASTLEDELCANAFLAQSAGVCERIAGHLEAVASPYAPLLRLIERRGRLAEACEE